MYIRRTQPHNNATSERYYTHRLVRSERTPEGKVRQVTLLNLGRHFPVEQSQWPILCARIEQLLSGQVALLPVECAPELEHTAQRCVVQYLVAHGEIRKAPVAPANAPEEVLLPDLQTVDVDSLELMRPRTVGIEQVGLWAMDQVNFVPLLEELGLNSVQRALVVGLVIGRMAAPPTIS
jgi:hypothetical protein